MNNLSIVWTAVVAVVAGLASILASIAGNDSLSISFGLCAVASSMLASRER
jgi:hypothetical protein